MWPGICLKGCHHKLQWGSPCQMPARQCIWCRGVTPWPSPRWFWGLGVCQFSVTPCAISKEVFKSSRRTAPALDKVFALWFPGSVVGEYAEVCLTLMAAVGCVHTSHMSLHRSAPHRGLSQDCLTFPMHCGIHMVTTLTQPSCLWLCRRA